MQGMCKYFAGIDTQKGKAAQQKVMDSIVTSLVLPKVCVYKAVHGVTDDKLIARE